MITKQQAFGMYIGRDIIAKNIHQGKLNCVLQNLDEEEKYLNDWQCGTDLETCGTISINDCKLILRPFERMTGDEIKGLFDTDITIMERNNDGFEYIDDDSVFVDTVFFCDIKGIKEIEYLISIGIDVFNLKERGWAVYEEDIK